MAFAQHDLAPKSWDLGRYVLTLSVLGIFSKVLRIDLSQLQIVGVKLGTESVALIPGFIGLALWYVLAAFIVAQGEKTLITLGDAQSKSILQTAKRDRPLRWLIYALLPFSMVAYFTPMALGVVATIYLWRDSITVAKILL